MMKKLLFLLLLISSPVFSQKMEHGFLIGAGAGFPMQDGGKFSLERPRYGYNHEVKIDGMIGYRFRFLAFDRSFIDLDATFGLQRMNVYRYNLPSMEDWENTKPGDYVVPPGVSFTDYIMPITVAGTWNYRFSEKFHGGLGIAPTLYVNPQVAFDLNILAKVGYRVCRWLELDLPYQYGCLNVLKHFNDGPAMGRHGHFSDLILSVYVPFVIK